MTDVTTLQASTSCDIPAPSPGLPLRRGPTPLGRLQGAPRGSLGSLPPQPGTCRPGPRALPAGPTVRPPERWDKGRRQIAPPAAFTSPPPKGDDFFSPDKEGESKKGRGDGRKGWENKEKTERDSQKDPGLQGGRAPGADAGPSGPCRGLGRGLLLIHQENEQKVVGRLDPTGSYFSRTNNKWDSEGRAGWGSERPLLRESWRCSLITCKETPRAQPGRRRGRPGSGAWGHRH